MGVIGPDPEWYEVPLPEPIEEPVPVEQPIEPEKVPA
jgi:hypothetical protein